MARGCWGAAPGCHPGHGGRGAGGKGTNTGNEGEPEAATQGERNTGNEGERDRSWRLTRGMREERDKSDQVVAKIAGRQHGVVSAAQLGPAGIEKDAVTRRVKACRLHRIHRVYAVGHTRLTFEGRCTAAVLAPAE